MAKKKAEAHGPIASASALPTELNDNQRTTAILREARKNLDVDALLGENQRLKARIRQLEALLKAGK